MDFCVRVTMLSPPTLLKNVIVALSNFLYVMNLAAYTDSLSFYIIMRFRTISSTLNSKPPPSNVYMANP